MVPSAPVGQCPHCGADLSSGEAVCSTGALDGPTAVTALANIAPDGQHAGEVLAERYELRSRLEADALTTCYRAWDQETEQDVLVRVVSPALLGSDSERRAALVRLRSAVGCAGRFLAEVLDCDCDARWLFTVEQWPSSGTTLRRVLAARRSRGAAFAPGELLPVVARLALALKAIPPPWRHGDVRAERVWVDQEAVRLSGAFIVGALPEARVAAALGADAGMRRAFAPEVMRGGASDAADRYGVAAIVVEALTGALPPDGGLASGQGLVLAVGQQLITKPLADALAGSPEVRPMALEPLIDALAAAAGLPVPNLDAGAFRRGRNAGACEHAQRADAQPLSTPADSATEQRAAASPYEGFDPRLVRAALASHSAPEHPACADGGETGAVQESAESSLLELGDEDLEVLEADREPHAARHGAPPLPVERERTNRAEQARPTSLSTPELPPLAVDASAGSRAIPSSKRQASHPSPAGPETGNAVAFAPRSSRWVLIVAIAVAAAIVLAGLVCARARHHASREDRLEKRFETLLRERSHQ